MGRSVTPTYRVEYSDNDRNSRQPKVMCWDTTRAGRPSAGALLIWRTKYNQSFETGGCNAHVSDAAGHIVRIGNCRIVHQKTGRVVATFDAPTFEVC